jgi:hypothetical protein
VISFVAASTTDWVQAIAAGVSAVVTAALIVLAVAQMIFTRRQATAAAQQVDQMRDDARDAGEHREREMAAQAAAERQRDEAVRTQLRALGDITEATRNAAHAQVQPIVFAHAVGPPLRGPDDTYDLSERQVAFPYYLRNEGVGTALNVRHGVSILNIISEFGEGMELRALRAGETVPPVDAVTGQPVVVRSFSACFEESDLPRGWERETFIYWTRFENPFGTTFEISNPSDPRQSAALMQITELPRPS